MNLSRLKLLPFVIILAVSLLAIFQLQQKNNLDSGEIVQIGINYLTKDSLLVADEKDHFDQIIRFTGPNPTIRSAITMLPGYHLLVAVIIRLISLIGIIGNTPFAARLISLFISLLFILAVYLTARKLDKKTAYLKTLQVSFFPLFFPFYFLLYTDLLSLTLIIFILYLTLQRRYYPAGLMLLISLSIRQSNIIWLPFFVFLMAVQEKEGRLRKGLVFLLSMVAFGVFVYLNGGISLGEKNMHPVTITQFSSFYFFLFTFFITLLPLHVINIISIFNQFTDSSTWKESIRPPSRCIKSCKIMFEGYSSIIQMLNRKKVIIAVILLGFIFYLFTFKVSHPYNHIHNFIRNDLLLFFVSDFWLKTVFYLLICLALLSLFSGRLIANRYYAFYFISLISILSSSLIEVRYYFVPLAFFLLLRKSQSKRVEYAVLFFFIVMAAAIVKITAGGKYFI